MKSCSCKVLDISKVCHQHHHQHHQHHQHHYHHHQHHHHHHHHYHHHQHHQDLTYGGLLHQDREGQLHLLAALRGEGVEGPVTHLGKGVKEAQGI